MDVALMEVIGMVLVLVYVMRDLDEVRVISLRRGSKQERKLYAENLRQTKSHRLGTRESRTVNWFEVMRERPNGLNKLLYTGTGLGYRLEMVNAAHSGATNSNERSS